MEGHPRWGLCAHAQGAYRTLPCLPIPLSHPLPLDPRLLLPSISPVLLSPGASISWHRVSAFPTLSAAVARARAWEDAESWGQATIQGRGYSSRQGLVDTSLLLSTALSCTPALYPYTAP